MPDTNFYKNITCQNQVINLNATLWHSKMVTFRKNDSILAQICNIPVSLTIQVTRLTFGIFSYGFLKTWVPGPYYLSLFDVEFPKGSYMFRFGC